MNPDRTLSFTDTDTPSWAMHQGKEDGTRSSHRRRSLDCTATTVSIPESEYIRDTSAGGYQVYIIEVISGHKRWRIKRRYSDFNYLDTQLRKFMKRTEIPVFPPKRFIGSSTDKEFVEERRADLERYISALVRCSTAWNASDFVRFLDNDDNSMMMLWNLEKMRRVQDVSIVFIYMAITVILYIIRICTVLIIDIEQYDT